MDTLAMIIGVGIYLFLLIFIAYTLNEQHVFWKIFTLLFVIFSMSILVKASVDTYTNCELVQVNSTVFGNTTTYGYDEVCVKSELKTPGMFLNAQSILMRVLGLYLVIYMLYLSSDKLLAIGNYFRGGRRK